MTPLLRAFLLLAGVAAVCLLALGLSVTIGVWLAMHAVAGSGPSATQAVTGAALFVTLVLLAKAVALLAADLRRPEVRW